MKLVMMLIAAGAIVSLGPLAAASDAMREITSAAAFHEIVDGESLLMAYFYAPWCGHCKALKSEIKEVADELMDSSPGVPLIAVDAFAERELAANIGVRGVPWVRIYYDGGAWEDYDGPIDAEGMLQDLLKHQAFRRAGVKLAERPPCGDLNVYHAKAGFGGHSAACRSHGQTSFGLCKQILSDSKDCSAMTYKGAMRCLAPTLICVFPHPLTTKLTTVSIVRLDRRVLTFPGVVCQVESAICMIGQTQTTGLEIRKTRCMWKNCLP